MIPVCFSADDSCSTVEYVHTPLLRLFTEATTEFQISKFGTHSAYPAHKASDPPISGPIHIRRIQLKN